MGYVIILRPPEGRLLPRYFFHTKNGKYTPDAEGIDLVDASVAQTTAIRLAGELLKDAPDVLRETTELKVEVMDANAVTLFTVLVRVLHPAAGQNSVEPTAAS
jgi:uncharacterized protein DUF6894